MLKQTDWRSRPVLSNGPYYIYERKDDRLVLVKNELYWDAKNVSIPRIVIRFAKDGAEAASLYDTAEAQWVAGDVDLDALKDRRGISLNAMFATHYYYVRSAAAPWNDKRVRRALSLALPWEEIRKEHLLPAATLIYPIPDYPKLEGVKETKADEAKKLLETYSADDPEYGEVAFVLLRAQVYTYLATKNRGLMRKAMMKIAERDPNQLGPFMQKGSSPVLLAAVREVLTQAGFATREKTKVERQ